VYSPDFTGITSAGPDLNVGLSMGTNSVYTNWNSQLSAYAPRYWNAVSIHFYPITTIQSLTNTIQTLNGILAHGTSDYISSYVDPLIGATTPIFITEFDCCSQNNNKFLTFLYDGVFMAEYMARMSVVPNVKGVGVNSLYTDNYDYHGVIQSVDDYESYLLAQLAANPNFSTNTATDPNTQFQFYTSAPGLALSVANQAINNSTQVWPTVVTGGPTVPIQGYDGKPIPAIYAQAYEGIDGSHYLLITNKSSATCVTTIQVNGVHVSGAMSVTTVSSPSSSAANTAQAQNNVQIQTSTSDSPITLGPYSVTVLNW
jgi:alpha-L-arabinofuranosidase